MDISKENFIIFGIELKALLKLFVNDLETLTRSYWHEDVIPISKYRNKKRADQLIERFNKSFDKHMSLYQKLIFSSLKIDEVTRNQFIRKHLENFRFALDKICMAINAESKEIISIFEKNKEIYFQITKLELLSKIDFTDIESAWIDEKNPLQD